MATRGFELSILELDLIGEVLGLDVRQFPFQFPYHGELIEDRQRLATVAQRTLEGKGLIAPGARFIPDLEELLGVYARGPLSLTMFGTAGDLSLYARVASDGRSAVLAQQREQVMTFTPISPEGLIRPLVSLLPPLKPGPGRSVTITRDPAVPARRPRPDDDEGYSARVLQRVRQPADSGGASQSYVDEIMQRPRLGSCAFTVNGRDRGGRPRKPLSMSTIDTESGRYALIPDERPDGTLDISVTPADLPRIDQALSRFVEMVG